MKSGAIEEKEIRLSETSGVNGIDYSMKTTNEFDSHNGYRKQWEFFNLQFNCLIIYKSRRKLKQ